MFDLLFLTHDVAFTFMIQGDTYQVYYLHLLITYLTFGVIFAIGSILTQEIPVYYPNHNKKAILEVGVVWVLMVIFIIVLWPVGNFVDMVSRRSKDVD